MNKHALSQVLTILVIFSLVSGCGSRASVKTATPAIPPSVTALPATATLPPTHTVQPATAALPPTATALAANATNTPAPYDANSNPGILPPDSVVQGMTYAEWIASWWKYVLSLPAPQNPIPPGTGPDCMLQCVEDVVMVVTNDWKGAPIQCEAPAGTMLLIPIEYPECSTLEGEPFYGGDEAELRACVQKFYFQDLEASIDGVEVQNLGAFFIPATPLYQFTVPDNNILGVPAASGESVANGIFLMLAPLSPGKHTIYTHAFSAQANFTVEKTLVLTVSENYQAGSGQVTPTP